MLQSMGSQRIRHDLAIEQGSNYLISWKSYQEYVSALVFPLLHHCSISVAEREMQGHMASFQSYPTCHSRPQGKAMFKERREAAI